MLPTLQLSIWWVICQHLDLGASVLVWAAATAAQQVLLSAGWAV
jgi:hypothetical protein